MDPHRARDESAGGRSANYLNELGVLTRREIEARVIAPLLEAFAGELGPERAREIAAEVIIRIARQQGAEVAAAMGGQTLAHFARSLNAWEKDGALSITILEQTEEKLSFDVTRCRYAELYRALGIANLGSLLSCNRDFAFIEGFSPRIVLRRTQTIMDGAPRCNFRYTVVGP